MDFNEIKNTWKDSFDEKERLSSGQIEAMLKIKSKSNNALNKIKSNFKSELITGVAMYLFIIAGIFLLVDIPQSIIFFVIVSLLMGLPLFFYFRTYKKIKHSNYTERNLKQSLINTTRDIEKFVLKGKRSYFKYSLIPLATITGMFIGLYAFSGEDNIIEIFNSLGKRTIVKMIILLTTFSGIMIPFSKYWFKKKFKQDYFELKKCLKELEEETNKSE